MGNIQGGDNKINPKLYNYAINYIKDGDRVLNLGCGIKFVFEKELSKKQKTTIFSIDKQNIKKKPICIKKFIKKSVEEKIKFSEKFDVITFFELIEHIDHTDTLLQNCYNNLKKNGYLIFSFPNFSSIFSRIELLFGFQPHILEISNICANFGTGMFGRINNSSNLPLHHIRGITTKAMKEIIKYNKFKIIKIYGYEFRGGINKILRLIPSFSPLNIFICKK